MGGSRTGQGGKSPWLTPGRTAMPSGPSRSGASARRSATATEPYEDGGTDARTIARGGATTGPGATQQT
jgi:hypothetical protein